MAKQVGKKLAEGKTKSIYECTDNATLCYIESKDRITAGDGARAHDLEGKAVISNETNALIFGLLNDSGLETAFVEKVDDVWFKARRCEMIPIEWVTRRIATGSFLKRNPGVKEGYRFAPLKLEFFYKDDANHDPQWSEEQIVAAGFSYNGRTIGQSEIELMKATAAAVFEILERAWATADCVLVDMKIEFGVDASGNIVLADIIDSDSWRLWPAGDKRQMVDKQVYRDLQTVTNAELGKVRGNFAWVRDRLKQIVRRDQQQQHLVVIVIASNGDKPHCEKLEAACAALGLNWVVRVTSAHKTTAETLRIVEQYSSWQQLVFIAAAGRSNGLGPVIAGNTTCPVINCPVVSPANVQLDIWSSLNMPSGIGCSTVLYPEGAALNAASIIGLSNHLVWAKLRAKQLCHIINLQKVDKSFANN